MAMLDDREYFRSPPYRYFGYGQAESIVVQPFNPPLAELCSLVGNVFVAGRITNAILREDPNVKAMVPVVVDILIYEGLASILIPKCILLLLRSVAVAFFDHNYLAYQLPLCLSVPALLLLSERIDREVSKFMDKTVRKKRW